MGASKLVSAVLVVAALLVFGAAMFFFFYKTDNKVEQGETPKSGAESPVPPSAKVLNVVTYLSNEQFNAMKSNLGESYLFDARSKSNSYQFNGVTVSVVSGELPEYPGYTMYTHTFPTAFKGMKLVFDGTNSNEFFEDPVTRLTAYWWFNSLLFLTLTTEKAGDAPLTKYFHYTAHFGQDALRWDRFDRDPNTLLDYAVLGPKLDELNTSAGNFVALSLDEYVEAQTGSYTTETDEVTVSFTLARRSSSQTGFVKMTHKLPAAAATAEQSGPPAFKPFKLKKLLVSRTELSDLVLTRKPVLSASVFWWYNIPLVADFELQGGAHEHLTYSVDTNKWGVEVVDKLRSKLFMLKNKLGDPLTLDLSKTADRDQTYTANGVLVRVSPAATSATGYRKFTHRFSTGSSHLVGSFSSHGTPQLGLPVLRVNEVSAYYLSDVPLLLKMSMSSSGGMSTSYLYFSNNGLGLWKKVVLDAELSTTAAVLKKLSEDNTALAMTDSYVFDARMKSNYLSAGKLVSVTKGSVENLQGFTTYTHSPSVRGPFKFEKFTVAGKDVLPERDPLPGTTDATVYWYLDVPMLLKVAGTSQPVAPAGPPPETPPSRSGEEESSSLPPTDQSSGAPEKQSTPPPAPRTPPEAARTEPFSFFYWYNADTKVWSALEEPPTTPEKLKAALDKARATLGKVTLNLGHSSGTFTSGPVTVTVSDSASYDNDPPTSFTKRVHTLSVPFPVSLVKHYDFDLELGNVTEERYESIQATRDPVVPANVVVQRMEVYFYGEVPLHFFVYGVEGAPLRFSNSFKGTLWFKYLKTNVSLKDCLLLQKVRLGHTAKMDVCKGSGKNDQLVTYDLKYLATPGSTPVSVSRSEVPNSDGVMLVQHKLPDNVSLKFSALTCGQRVLTGLNSDEFHTVMVYYKDQVPMYVKANSDPKYFAMSGDGGLTRLLPPEGATSFTDEQVNTAVSTLSAKVGKVFDVDVSKKEGYTLDATEFLVTKSEEAGFEKYLHKLKSSGEEQLSFTVRTFMYLERDAVVFSTGLKVSEFAVFYKGDTPLFLHLKVDETKPKFYNYVYDSGLWLDDGVHEAFQEEDLWDRLEYLQEGLGNEFSLDLAEDLGNKLFNVDVAEFDLVPGYKKYTYKPEVMDFPFLLKDLLLSGSPVNLPLEENHLFSLTAYTFRKNYLFFHVVSHDKKDFFYKSDFAGGYTPVTFERYDEDSLERVLWDLKAKVADQLSLELTKEASYPYHEFTVNVVLQNQTSFEGYKKYLHDLVEGETSVPFKLYSVKNDGYVTNVPLFNELVYFAYVYMYETTPLLLELHSSNKDMSSYHYYYFSNNLGNWELLENPSLGQLPSSNLKEVLNSARDKMSKTFKVDLARKFSAKLLTSPTEHFHLNVSVMEDVREAWGFSVYSHVYSLEKTGNVEDRLAPTAANLGATTLLEPSSDATSRSAEQETRVSTPGSLGRGAVPSTLPESLVQTLEGAPAATVLPDQSPSQSQSALQPESTRSVNVAERVLNTYQTLKANALRGVNVMSAALPVVGKFTLGDTPLSGFGVDTVFKANVYWWLDQSPAFVHLCNGVNNKYYMKKGDKWALAKKSDVPLSRATVASMLDELKDTFVKPVELDLDKSSSYDSYVKYVSEGFTLRVVPSFTLEGGFRGFTHFSATNHENVFKVNRLEVWGDVVLTELQDGFVRSATVFTDSDLLPLVLELEWTKLNNSSFKSRFKYFKYSQSGSWVVHQTDNNHSRLVEAVLLALLKQVRAPFANRVTVSLERRENYGESASAVAVSKDPATTPGKWNGFHKLSHALNNPAAKMLLLKMSDRLVRAYPTATHVKRVDSYWYKNSLLLVKVTEAASAESAQDTVKYFKNDHKDDLLLLEGVAAGELTVGTYSGDNVATQPSALLTQLAAHFKDEYYLDVAERTLGNKSDFLKLLPALYVVDTSVPTGYARYNLYLLDHVKGVKLNKLLYHGTDFSTGNFALPEDNVYSVYAFTPVGHFSPFLLELHVRTSTKLVLYYYHLNQYGKWVKLETGGRRLTHEEFYGKLNVLFAKLGNVTVVDVSKNEGTYYGLTRMNVTKFSFPGVRGYTKYLHKAHDNSNFTVSKFVNKGVVLQNLPVMKASQVAVYFSLNKPLMLELKVGRRYKFFSSNANGQWFEARLPSGDLKSALDSVYDEHADVARNTGNKVSLHLNANFTRDYVLSEGKVEDFEGAVAVLEEEPEEPAAPRAPSRVDTADADGDANLSTALSSADTAEASPSVARASVPPADQMVKTHVLNPLLYLDNDKLAYSYSSYGKTVFVNRRDDLFHGYNVTTHKFSENAPFSLRKLVFLGREFDLGLGNLKFLSATLFSFSFKPLVLKLVQLDGTERLFSFTFLTQTWTALQVSDLENALDDLNYKENKLLMLDLAKDSNYEVNGQELNASKTAFTDGFSKHTTQSKRSFDARNRLKAKRDAKLQEKLKTKEKYRLDSEQKKRRLDSLKVKLADSKAGLDSLLALWVKSDASKANLFKVFYEKEVAVAALEKEVKLAEAEYEEAVSTDSRETGDKNRALAAKKQQLDAKKKELEQAKVAAAESLLTFTESSSTEKVVKTKLSDAVASAKALQEHVKPSTLVDAAVTAAKALRRDEQANKLADLVLAADKLTSLKSDDKVAEMASALTTLKDLVLALKAKFETGPKFEAAHAYATKLKEAVTAVTDLGDSVSSTNFSNVLAAVKKLNTSVLESSKLTDAYDAAVKFKFLCEGSEKLKEANAVLTKLASTVDSLLALEPAGDLSSTSTDEAKLAKATTFLSNLKEAVKDKLDVAGSVSLVKGEFDKFKSDFAYDTSEKFTAALTAFDKLQVYLSLALKLKEFVNEGGDSELEKLLNECNNATAMDLKVTNDLSAKLKEVLSLAEKLKPLDAAFKAAVDPESPSSSGTTKLKTLVASSNAFSESLKTEALKKVESALGDVEKSKEVESVLLLLDDAAKVALTVKEVVPAVEQGEDKTTLEDMKPVVLKLKQGLNGFEKLWVAYEAAKNLKVTLDDNTDKLKKAYDACKALHDKVVEADNQTTDGQGTEKLRAVLDTFKQKKVDLKADDVTAEAKKQVTAKKTQLTESLKTSLKEGCNGAKKLYEKHLVLLAEAQKSYDTAFRRYDLYDMTVHVSDDEDDGTSESSVLFGFGGLRLGGKNLSSAGLPVGNFLHTFNAYFANGSELPLMVQLKYSDSEDADEPVVDKMKRPPPASLLLNAELPSTTTVPASQRQAQAEPGAAGTGAPTFTHAVERVSSLLRTGLVEVTPKVSMETAQVVPPATPASGSDSISGSDTEQLPPPPRQPEPFSYPGHFFVLDLDLTWKPFVPEAKGSLRHKLLELKELHALDVNLDLANVSARRMTTYALKTRNFSVRRVLYSSGYKLTRDSSKLQGSEAPTKPHVVDLSDYDQSVKFFPPLDFKWFVHQMVPSVPADATKPSDPLPQFNLQALSLNGSRLSLGEDASEALLGSVNSVSALVNGNGTPLMLLAYKPVSNGNLVQHKYVSLSLKGDKYVVDDSMSNFSNLLYNLEHSDFAWTSDATFMMFTDAMQQRLNLLNAQLEPSYVVNLNATKNYKRGNVVVSVESSEAFDVKYLSFTPGLLVEAAAEGGESSAMPSTVPAFTLEKVFSGDTKFKGLTLPFRNVLHVSVFEYKFLRPLKESSPKEYSFFPLLLELSHRNEANRLENFYFRYLSGDKFELCFKTKLRLTAAEVADVVKFVAHENLRRGNFTLSTLSLNFWVKSTFYTPRHFVTVEKLEKVQAALAPGAPEGTLPSLTNAHLPDGYNVYKYTLHQNDTPYTVVSLFFWNHWKFSPNKHTFKEFYLYVRARDNLADLLALVTPGASGAAATYEWYSLATPTPVAVLTGEVVSPTSSEHKNKLDQLLATVTANVDFWLQPEQLLWAFFTTQLTAKLSPVGNVQGFPVTATPN
uniref:Uncharacterized protein n=1 Tax=Theileria annulata TaxID=5874 RepID=A0A3B0MNA6_THEAN